MNKSYASAAPEPESAALPHRPSAAAPDRTPAATAGGARQLPPLLKLVLELGPLAVFFFANARPGAFLGFASLFLDTSMFAALPPDRRGIFVATAAFMLATMLALGISYALARRVPVMPLVSGAVVVVFGGLTLFLQDEFFIKLKPTIVNLLFGSALLGGLLFGKSLLGYVFDSVIRLDEAGWRKLTLRWGLFFFVLAALNEIVWRNFSNDVWVNFKVFGIMPLTFLFAMAQFPLLQRHMLADEPAGPGPMPG